MLSAPPNGIILAFCLLRNVYAQSPDELPALPPTNPRRSRAVIRCRRRSASQTALPFRPIQPGRTAKNCGYQGPLSTPVVYHDPEKEFFLTYFPPELGLPLNEQERMMGPYITQVVNRLPPEKRKAYLFPPAVDAHHADDDRPDPRSRRHHQRDDRDISETART